MNITSSSWGQCGPDFATVQFCEVETEVVSLHGKIGISRMLVRGYMAGPVLNSVSSFYSDTLHIDS